MRRLPWLFVLAGACTADDPAAFDVPEPDASAPREGDAGTGGEASTGDGDAAGEADTAPTDDPRLAATTKFPVDCPGPLWSAPTPSGPISVTANAAVIRGVHVTNPDGHCITIAAGVVDVKIETSEIGPCAGSGIFAAGASTIRIADSFIHDTGGEGVSLESAHDVSVRSSCIARVRSGVYALTSTGVVVERNSVLDVQGPMPRGQLVQLDKCSGPGIRIACNLIENRPGTSQPEDAINIYQSNGTAASPIDIVGNRIHGGGPSLSGGGILLGDGGGSWQIARANVSVDPGQYGNAVAGGSHLALLGNVIFGRQQAFTNIGMYVWNQYSPPCDDVAVRSNRIHFVNKDGQPNTFWNAGNCTNVDVGADNDFQATITPAVLHAVPQECR